MKGITHFLSGLALGSFIAPAVRAATATRAGLPGAEASMILVLGGLYGIMPDTLDFKLGQFFSVPDYEVEPDPNDPNPQLMAEILGKAIDEVWETGEYKKIQFYPIQLASNLWRQYVIKFDGENNEVSIVINEIVTTSQIPIPGTEPPENKRVGVYKLKGKLLETHGRPSVVDIMSGPQFGLRKENDYVVVEFLPWHRTWSHSYIMGLFLSIPIFIITWLLNLKMWWLYGLISLAGFAVHITEDLTGHMGGSLLWPFFKKRTDGFGLFSASDPNINLTVNYIAIVLTIFNLDRFTTHLIKIPFIIFLPLFIILPLILYWLFIRKFLPQKEPVKPGALKAEHAIEALKYRLQNEELMFEDDSIPIQ